MLTMEMYVRCKIRYLEGKLYQLGNAKYDQEENIYTTSLQKKGHREKNIFVVSCYPYKKATRFNQQSNQCPFLFFRTSKLISCQLLKILETNDWLQNFNNRIHSGGRVANDTRAPIQHSNWRFIDLNTFIQGQDPPVGDCVDISIS